MFPSPHDFASDWSDLLRRIGECFKRSPHRSDMHLVTGPDFLNEKSLGKTSNLFGCIVRIAEH